MPCAAPTNLGGAQHRLGGAGGIELLRRRRFGAEHRADHIVGRFARRVGVLRFRAQARRIHRRGRASCSGTRIRRARRGRRQCLATAARCRSLWPCVVGVNGSSPNSSLTGCIHGVGGHRNQRVAPRERGHDDVVEQDAAAVDIDPNTSLGAGDLRRSRLSAIASPGFSAISPLRSAGRSRPDPWTVPIIQVSISGSNVILRAPAGRPALAQARHFFICRIVVPDLATARKPEEAAMRSRSEPEDRLRGVERPESARRARECPF